MRIIGYVFAFGILTCLMWLVHLAILELGWKEFWHEMSRFVTGR